MTRRPSKEDQRLWNAVARSVTRNGHMQTRDPGRSIDGLREEMATLMGSSADIALPRKPSAIRPPQKPVHASQRPQQPPQTARKNPAKSTFRPNALDDRAFRDLKKGKLAIDGRLDLHGMTQDEAQIALDNFLVSARVSGRRHVLVITGKGRANDGVLKRVVPIWLTVPPFSQHVNGVREAHIEHGGSGALYVRLKRPL